MFDLLIKGGTVVDGTGATARTADIAVRDGIIVEIGSVSGASRQIIDADGAIVSPGWIDAHTHYDGQVTWDDRLEGSASNGVTSVVMGNCGVGFAPIARGREHELIDLMEGVEDIPGTVLYEGVPWGKWETFPEYLDFLDKRSWTVDVGAQLPHGALRFYVMGERAVDKDATADDLHAMSIIAREAARAGAIGFSTSRMTGHRSMSGDSVPGTYAAETELDAIVRGIREGGGGVIQAIPSNAIGELIDVGIGTDREHTPILEEIAMLARLSRQYDLPVVISTFQFSSGPECWRSVLAAAIAANESGARIFPMVAPKAITSLVTLRGYHYFMRRPTFLRIAELPHTHLLQELRTPEVKSAILSEDDTPNPRPGSMQNILPAVFWKELSSTFRLQNPIDYEPDVYRSLLAEAQRQGSSLAEYLYDFLLEDEGKAVGVNMGQNYAYGNLDATREMLLSPVTLMGLSDAGAHVNFICDMPNPTFGLTHWVRDRCRGEKLPIELVVAKSTAANAKAFGLHDRGVLTVGKRADINVIDFENLTIQLPSLHHDLPAGGSRFLQGSTGYLATFVAGVRTRANDQDTGVRPGRLARRRP